MLIDRSNVRSLPLNYSVFISARAKGLRAPEFDRELYPYAANLDTEASLGRLLDGKCLFSTFLEAHQDGSTQTRA
jgi:hypothetical protein